MEQNNSLPRILVFIDWYLPGYKAGGPVRSMANMIDHLSGSFAFDVVTRNTEYMETIPYPSVRSDQWNTLAPNVRVWYASSNHEGLGQWRQLMREGHYHLIYINGIYSPKYSIMPLLAAKLEKQTNIVVAPRGMVGKGALTIKSKKKTLFIKLVKLVRLFNNIRWHATADTEKEEIILNFGNKSKIIVAPNLHAKGDIADSKTMIAKQTTELKICFVSRIALKKNLLYALEAIKNVKLTIDLQFDIFGPLEELEYWQKCEEMIKTLPPHVRVQYKGALLPGAIRSTMQAYHGMLFPTMHENFGHVILESLMAGRPVIISDQTPWRNLESKMAGFDLPLQDMDVLTQTIEKMAAMDQESFNRWCHGAAQVAREFVEDKALMERYVEMLRG